jgi:hypothetical protein
VLGQKDYFFAGSDSGGIRAAKMYTLEIAKLNGPDSEAYLRDIIALTADHPINLIDELLPWTWKAVADKAGFQCLSASPRSKETASNCNR